MPRKLTDYEENGWIETFSGERLYLAKPRPNEICIEDIAHALSLLCRYGGHCIEFYSVAEHSVRVSKELPKEYQLAGLLHDAAEAYVGDVTRSLKRLLPEYIDIEHSIQHVIDAKYGIKYTVAMMDAVKETDDILIATEGRDLMPNVGNWAASLGVPQLKEVIVPYSSSLAKSIFLLEFYRLYKGGK